MKVIFLDIDGVLNNATTKEKFCGFDGIDVRLRDMFLNWLKQRDYQIVLSSSWRIPTAFGDFKAELNRNGISWIDETPRLPSQGRGWEVQAILTKRNILPDQYVILDDLGPSEFIRYQRSRLVQTSYVKGLQEKNLKKIDELLGN